MRGEEFKIENWAQCDKCQKWRRINFNLRKAQTFTCKLTGTNCQKKQESAEEYITLADLKE